MAIAFYMKDIDDPDLDYMVSNFLAENPDYMVIEGLDSNLPIVLLPYYQWEPPDF